MSDSELIRNEDLFLLFNQIPYICTNNNIPDMNNLNQSDIKDREIEMQFKQLSEQAKKLYPQLEETIETFKNINKVTCDIEDYNNLLHEPPQATSTNNFTLR